MTGVWRVDDKDENHFYLVMQTRNDGTLLAKCNETSSGEVGANVLWRLERSGDAYNPEALQEDVREMNGGDENLRLFSAGGRSERQRYRFCNLPEKSGWLQAARLPRLWRCQPVQHDHCARAGDGSQPHRRAQQQV